MRQLVARDADGLCVGASAQYCSKRAQELFRERREIVTLLTTHKYDKARIRGESLYRKEREIEAYEVLELMCELLHERTVSSGPPTQRSAAARRALRVPMCTSCCCLRERGGVGVVVDVQGVIEKEAGCPPDLLESICTVIWAASRIDFIELQKARHLSAGALFSPSLFSPSLFSPSLVIASLCRPSSLLLLYLDRCVPAV